MSAKDLLKAHLASDHSKHPSTPNATRVMLSKHHGKLHSEGHADHEHSRKGSPGEHLKPVREDVA